MKNIYEIRKQGRDYCQTEGSNHYKEGGIEPLDLMMAKGVIEDFCIGNMIKYATRFKVTRKLDDLKKVSDYAHIMAGMELENAKSDIPKPDNISKCTEESRRILRMGVHTND